MRKTIKLNNEILKQMRKIYYSKGDKYIDWMGFRITEVNKPSYHHIKKAEILRKENENDDATMENGAYLGKKSHELLHKIEMIDKDLYNAWNHLFLLINKTKKYPTEDIWNLVYNLKQTSINLLDEYNKNDNLSI